MSDLFPSVDARLGEWVNAQIATFDAACDEAQKKWSGAMIRVGSWLPGPFGGQEPDVILATIQAIRRRAEPWKARGAAMGMGKPYLLAQGTDNARFDSPPEWLELGKTMLSEVQTISGSALSAGLDGAFVYTVKETTSTIGQGVADIAEDIADTATATKAVLETAWSWRRPLVWLVVLVALVYVVVQGGLLGAFAALSKATKKKRKK